MSNILNRFIATAGGIGYLPIAPGTWAAGVTAFFWFLYFKYFPEIVTWQIVILLIIIVAGIYCSGKIASKNEKDPSHIVIDEVAGMIVTLLLIPPSLINIITGFILFRLFDIAKPLGIKKMEAFRNGWGIMLDDILAGIYSNILLRFLILLKIW